MMRKQWKRMLCAVLAAGMLAMGKAPVQPVKAVLLPMDAPATTTETPDTQTDLYTTTTSAATTVTTTTSTILSTTDTTTMQTVPTILTETTTAKPIIETTTSTTQSTTSSTTTTGTTTTTVPTAPLQLAASFGEAGVGGKTWLTLSIDQNPGICAIAVVLILPEEITPILNAEGNVQITEGEACSDEACTVWYSEETHKLSIVYANGDCGAAESLFCRLPLLISKTAKVDTPLECSIEIPNFVGKHPTVQLLPPPSLTVTPTYQRGDVNMDGAVSVDDALMCLIHYADHLAMKPDVLNAQQFALANVRQDDVVDVEDALAILCFYADTLALKYPEWSDILSGEDA